MDDKFQAADPAPWMTGTLAALLAPVSSASNGRQPLLGAGSRLIGHG